MGSFGASFKAFADESLRGICAHSLLHLVDDLLGVLSRVFRWLEPGGFFAEQHLSQAQARGAACGFYGGGEPVHAHADT